jgi:protein-L-isoaspartate O-methyltransferase
MNRACRPKMIEALGLAGSERVLEVCTGYGF